MDAGAHADRPRVAGSVGPSIDARSLTDAVYARYRAVSRFAAGYVRGKLRGDPVYAALLDLVPEGASLLDLGCGDGRAAILLALHGCKVSAIDWDARKLGRASLAGRGLDATFELADVRSAPLPPNDVTLLLDVLHYFATAEQDALVARAAAALRPGGLLVIRDVDASSGWRSAVTIFAERFMTLARFHRADRVAFRSASELVAVLERAGLTVEARPMWKGTPFSNVLLVGRRKG